MLLGILLAKGETAMSTGLWVALLGIIVSYIGWAIIPGDFGAGVLGFGLAHIILGLLDTAFNRRSATNETNANAE